MTLAVYIPAAVILPNSGGTITHLEDIPFDPALEDIMVRAAGATFPGFTGSGRAQPVYNLGTTQLKTILDYATTEAVARAHSTGNCDIEYQLMTDLGTRTANATTSHQRHRMARSLFSLASIDAPEGSGFASCNFQILPTSADDSNPVTVTSNVALTATHATGDVFALGPVKVDGTLYCVDSWSLSLGLEYELRFCSGGPFLRFAAVRSVNPVLTVRMQNQAQVLANWSTGGAAISSSVVAFLRKRAAGGLNVANATEEHISITGTAGTVKPAGRNELRIQLHNITYDTTAAIA
jgi:hypothetical protein